jgi:hypothetical protein
MLPFLLAAGIVGTQQAYLVSWFEPGIETAPALTYQYWDAGPSIDDLKLIAKREGRDGEAGIRCSIAQDGRLKHCRVVEQLGGRGFGSAALGLSRKFLVKAELAKRARAANASIVVRLPFCAAAVCDPWEWRPAGYRPPRNAPSASPPKK